MMQSNQQNDQQPQPQPPQFTTDEEAVNALQFRQPNGSQPYGQLAASIYAAFRRFRQFEIAEAYANAVQLADLIFGYTAEIAIPVRPAGGATSAATSAGGKGGRQGGAAVDGEPASEADNVAADSEADESLYEMDSVNLTSVRVSLAMQIHETLSIMQARDRMSEYGETDWPDPSGAAEYAKNSADALVAALLADPRVTEG